MKTNGFINYSYLLEDHVKKTCIVVDPSWEKNKIDQIIVSNNLNLEAILLTHSHFDHTNLVDTLVREHDAKVYISRIEAEFYKYKCMNMNMVENGEIISFGGIEIEVVMAPGHTKGGVIYKCEDNLFTGDSIFIEGCGYCKTRGGSSEEMFETVQKIKLFPKNTKLWPGHAFKEQPFKTLEFIMENNLYFLIDKKIDFVKFSDRRNARSLFKFV